MPCVQFQVIPFMFFHIMRILISQNVTIIAVNFTQDEKSSFVMEAVPVQVNFIVAYPRSEVAVK